MSMIKITFPDGAVKEFPKGITQFFKKTVDT